MKITLYSLTCDWHDSGTETEVFGTEQEFLDRLKIIIEKRFEEIGNPEEYFGPNPGAKRVEEVKVLLEAGKIMDAWGVYRARELHHPDDCFWLGEHEVDIPEGFVITSIKPIEEHPEFQTLKERYGWDQEKREFVSPELQGVASFTAPK